MNRIILHIDFDSFFASCEQQFDPSLRGRPMGVTATNGRTCIIAASREAKKIGVRAPSRVWEVQKTIPEFIPVPAQFDRYWEISKKFIAIAKDYSPFVEVFSLDEVFMDVTSTAHLFGGVDALIAQLKKKLADEVGEYITVSVGISHNKLLAKLASGLKKPNGVMAITAENQQEVYDTATLTDICGIGNRIQERLNLIGVFTLQDLAVTPLQKLVREFGNVEGHFLANVGQGIDTRPVVPYWEEIEVKSVGRNYCLPQNEYSVSVVLQNMYELCEEVAIKLRRLTMSARTIGCYLRGSEDFSVRKTHDCYSTTGKEIFEFLMLGLNGSRVYSLPYKGASGYIRQISIWVSNLEYTIHTPQSLFEGNRKKEKLAATIDTLNKRYGNHTLRNGFLLYADKLTTKPNGFMADRFERIQIQSI